MSRINKNWIVLYFFRSPSSPAEAARMLRQRPAKPTAAIHLVFVLLLLNTALVLGNVSKLSAANQLSLQITLSVRLSASCNSWLAERLLFLGALKCQYSLSIVQYLPLLLGAGFLYLPRSVFPFVMVSSLTPNRSKNSYFRGGSISMTDLFSHHILGPSVDN